MANRFTRRQLFRLHPADLVRGIVEGRSGGAPPIRPPGAIPENRFLTTCERCGGCARACPHDVIGHLGPAAGRAEGTPFLEPEETACRWCAKMDCVDACPSGALRLRPGEPARAIATARIELHLCLVSQGTLCDTCVHFCPPEIRAVSIVRRFPVIDAEACVGCGQCSVNCDAPSSAIRIEPAPRAAGDGRPARP